MKTAFERLNELFPNKIIYNICQYPELYCYLSGEAKSQNKTLKQYVLELGFAYGEDATILRLEEKTEKALASIGTDVLNATLLSETNQYNNIVRITRFYGITIKEYVESLGYKYVKKNKEHSKIDSEMAKILRNDFNFTFSEIGKIVGVSKQWVEDVLSQGRDSSVSWRTNNLSDVKVVFEFMIKKHIFEYYANDVRYIFCHNLDNEICFVWYDELNQNCAFKDDIPKELYDLIIAEKMDTYFPEDYDVLNEIYIVNRLKKPYIKINNTKLLNKACKKHAMTHDEYAQFLGYSGYLSKKDINIDHRFIEFFENNMIDDEVYISSDPSNQWIKSFASRNKMTIDEFVEFYGYKKAGRGKFSALEEYLQQTKSKFKQELAQIAVDGEVYVQGKLYQRLNIFAKKNKMTIDELILELGFHRKKRNKIISVSQSEKMIENDLDELDKDIQNALSYERDWFETKEKKSQIIARNIKLVSRLKKIYGYKCQLCSDEEWMPILKNDGTYYSEVHHIKRLADSVNEEESLDKLDNMIVVCPNHHKMLHFHRGGYERIVRKGGKLYFENDSGEMVEIMNNYHLKVNCQVSRHDY